MDIGYNHNKFLLLFNYYNYISDLSTYLTGDSMFFCSHENKKKEFWLQISKVWSKLAVSIVKTDCNNEVSLECK